MSHGLPPAKKKGHVKDEHAVAVVRRAHSSPAADWTPSQSLTACVQPPSPITRARALSRVFACLLAHSHTDTHTHSHGLCISLHLSVALSLSVCGSVSASLCLSVSIFLSLVFSLSLSLSLPCRTIALTPRAFTLSVSGLVVRNRIRLLMSRSSTSVPHTDGATASLQVKGSAASVLARSNGGGGGGGGKPRLKAGGVGGDFGSASLPLSAAPAPRNVTPHPSLSAARPRGSTGGASSASQPKPRGHRQGSGPGGPRQPRQTQIQNQGDAGGASPPAAAATQPPARYTNHEIVNQSGGTAV